MGLFFGGDEERFIPGVRKAGFSRYKEILEANYKDFFLVGFVTLVFYLPFALALAWAVLAEQPVAVLLSGVVGGAVSGPGYACLVDLILRRLRDDKADRWVCWRRSMKQNAAASLLPGAVQGLLLAVLVYSGALMLWGRAPATVGTLLLMALSALVGTMLLTVWWTQVVLFEQKTVLRLRNAVLFCILRFGKAALSAALQLVWWAAMFLLLPWTAFVVPVLGVWYILFVALHIIYPALDGDFRVEEQIMEKFPERLGD